MLRVVWGALPVTVGPALSGLLDGEGRSVRLLAYGLCWAGWAFGLLTTLVFHPIGLTTLRLTALGGLAAAGVAATGSAAVGWRALALAGAAAAAGLAMSASTGELHVNGPAYPNERRFLLKPPAWLWLGPFPIAAICALTGVAVGPLLLASQRWIVGGLITVVGLPAAAIAIRSLHGLSRRFVVFVPAGFVISDAMSLGEAHLFQRLQIAGLGLARDGTGAYDLTGPATGLAVEVSLKELADVLTVRTGMIHAKALLIAPTRPGRFLAEARARRFADLPE